MEKFKEQLLLESKKWLEKGIISSTQAYNICNLYGIDSHEYEEPSKKSYNILMILGYLFLGISILILIGENWERVPRWIRMSSLMVLVLTIHSFGIKEFSKNKSKGTMLFFFGSFLYGVSIVLIAQMYHLGEHMPDGVLWWAIGVLPFVFLTRSNWMMLFFLILGFMWYTLELEMGYNKYSFVVVLAIAYYALFRYKVSPFPFIVSVIITFIWSNQMLSEFIVGDRDISLINIGMLIALFGLSSLLSDYKSKKFKSYATILQSTLLLVTIILLFILTFKDMWSFILDEHYYFLFFTISHAPVTLLPVVLSLSLVFIGVLLTILSKKSFHIILFFALLFTMVVLMLFFSPNALSPLSMQVIFNIIFALFAIYFIMEGMQKESALYFFLGIGAILLVTYIRYVNLIGGYIGSSLLFLTFALIMLGSAKYWNQYKKEKELTHEN